MLEIEKQRIDRALIDRSGSETDGKILCWRSDFDAGMAGEYLRGDYEVIDVDLDTGETVRSTGVIKFPKPEKSLSDTSDSL